MLQLKALEAHPDSDDQTLALPPARFNLSGVKAWGMRAPSDITPICQ